MKKLTHRQEEKPPARILQFGTGNFLRAFADWMVDVANEKIDFNAGILVVNPTSTGSVQPFDDQNGLYHVILTGTRNGDPEREVRLIRSVSEWINPYADYNDFLKTAENGNIRFILSNTTEAGIQVDPGDALEQKPPKSFPGKVTAWLYRRFEHFKGERKYGIIFLPCELIENNGGELRACIFELIEMWDLPASFADWIRDSCHFCDTLVDRIVPGYPQDAENIHKDPGYKDDLMVEGEQYGLWVIKAGNPVRDEWPLDKAGLNVIYTGDLDYYRTRKVRILNGAHTMMVPLGLLAGKKTVREVMTDAPLKLFLEHVIPEEVIPAMRGSQQDLKAYVKDTFHRFENPFLDHRLVSIALNSFSKFKVRVVPSMVDWHRKNSALPSGMVFSLAALVYWYAEGSRIEGIELNDDPQVIQSLAEWWATGDINRVVANVLDMPVWKSELDSLDGLNSLLVDYIHSIRENGIPDAIEKI